MSDLNNYADVQNALSTFVKNSGVNIASAPHGVFWENLSYDEFIKNNVPGVTPPFKLLKVGDSANSTLIQILKGVGKPAEYFEQMPRPNPPYAGQSELIQSLANWIDAGCPN